MLDNFVYENHIGQRFIGLDNGVYINHNDLRDYSWSYDKINDRISRFYRPISTRKLPLMVVNKSDAEAVLVRNRLFDIAEADINAMRPGKVYVGDYYINGYITASKKSNYLMSRQFCKLDLTLTSDNPAWYKETVHTFLPGVSSGNDIVDGIDYPFDYPWDYGLPMDGRRIVNDTVGDSAFRLLIYAGAGVNNPSVLIGGHQYAINGTLKSGETLLIDSLQKTITLTTAAGNKLNWFDKRNRDSYIFQPIPAGQSIVGWLGTFGFDLTIIEERSEPRWT